MRRRYRRGELSALATGHSADTSWLADIEVLIDDWVRRVLVGSCVRRSSMYTGSRVEHIWHIIGRNSSIQALVTTPPVTEAKRSAVGEPWILSPCDSGDA